MLVMADQDIPQRVTRLETQMAEVRADVSEIRHRLDATATKQDLADLRDHLDRRDESQSGQVWWLVRSLVYLLGLLVLAAFGIDRLPELWR